MEVLPSAWTPSYLMVALPQSSSTAASLQLGAMALHRTIQSFPCCHGRPCFTHDGARRHPASVAALALLEEDDPLYALSTRHSDMCELSTELVATWLNSSTIYKQHMAPTEANLARTRSLLEREGTPGLVVLLREPHGSLHAQCERERRDGGAKRVGAWLRRPTSGASAHLAGLQAWHERWTAFAAGMGPSRVRVLTYERMSSPELRRRALLGVLRFWHLETHDATSRFNASPASLGWRAHFVRRNDAMCDSRHIASRMQKLMPRRGGSWVELTTSWVRAVLRDWLGLTGGSAASANSAARPSIRLTWT
jgi:hypothetical protein